MADQLPLIASLLLPSPDVHAGNLLVLPDGRVGFIDFGIVGRIRSVADGAWIGVVCAGSAAGLESLTAACRGRAVFVTLFLSLLPQCRSQVTWRAVEALLLATGTGGQTLWGPLLGGWGYACDATSSPHCYAHLHPALHARGEGIAGAQWQAPYCLSLADSISFLSELSPGDYETMAKALVTIGATSQEVNIKVSAAAASFASVVGLQYSARWLACL